jgi:hypothetical protein
VKEVIIETEDMRNKFTDIEMSENSGNEENKVGHLFIQVKRMKPIDN